MFRNTISAFGVFALTLVGLGTALDGLPVRPSLAASRTELLSPRDQLDGTWEVVELVRGDVANRVLPEEDMSGTVSFEGNSFRFTISSLGQEMDRREATVAIDYSRSPGTIDLTYITGPDHGRTVAGIFEMNGDELRICLPIRAPFEDRPTEFRADQGSNRELFTLRRVK